MVQNLLLRNQISLFTTISTGDVVLAIVMTYSICVDQETNRHNHSHIEEGETWGKSGRRVVILLLTPPSLPTIAYDSEGNNVASMEFDEDSDQSYIEDHTLHQHPHEHNQEEVVEQHSNG